MRIIAVIGVAVVLIAIGVTGTLAVQALTGNDEPSGCEFLSSYYETAIASEPTPEPDIEFDEVLDIIQQRRPLEFLRDTACGKYDNFLAPGQDAPG